MSNYGHLLKEPGQITFFIDLEEGTELNRYSLTINENAFIEYLVANDLPDYELKEALDAYYDDRSNEHIHAFISMTPRTELIPLDENNQPIKEPLTMFKYTNQ